MRLAALVLSALLSVGVQAAPRQSDILPSGGFLNVCAAPIGGGGGFWAGDDITGQFAAGTCNTHYFNSGAVSDTASSSGPLISNNAAGAARMGWVQMSAENHSPAETWFAHGGVNGGYTDRLSVNAAGHAGESGFLLLRIAVNGTMWATAEAGGTGFQVVPYLNQAQVSAVHPGYDDGSSNHLWGTDLQVGAWGVGSAPDSSLAINEVITFSLPVVVGESMDVGLYTHADAGQRSSGGYPGWMANSGLSFTSYLDGATLMLGGVPVSGFSIASASGLDWKVSAVPEPGIWMLMLAGLGCVALRRRR
ncbi:MAG: PEP-CTERM sorting domain-containing protein [Rubrivivax sp.]|nr:MAG: PEP-CTERM sorting domain-containing protein [Rubrivivax sp.]